MATSKATTAATANAPEQVSDKIFTAANVISFLRLCLVPVFFFLIVNEYDVAAALVFGFAAATDFVDGQVARRTHTVSLLGQLLDPIVDRVLMITGVVGVFLTGRLPLWIIIVVIARDALILAGGAYLLFGRHIRIPVIYLGKVATTFLFFGFFGLVLNWPLVPGLNWVDFAWLPGFTSDPVSWGIWLIYIGLVLSLTTTGIYIAQAIDRLKNN